MGGGLNPVSCHPTTNPGLQASEDDALSTPPRLTWRRATASSSGLLNQSAQITNRFPLSQLLIDWHFK